MINIFLHTGSFSHTCLFQYVNYSLVWQLHLNMKLQESESQSPFLILIKSRIKVFVEKIKKFWPSPCPHPRTFLHWFAILGPMIVYLDLFSKFEVWHLTILVSFTKYEWVKAQSNGFWESAIRQTYQLQHFTWIKNVSVWMID